ncbi:hypothetical protein E2C01_061703 [Portunus trituberculatus]|uniref:Uncharacterized protein n=1 Tax=Portunus trituberculatus TaxID=210409 RepID=A0A5B7HBY5_PORTR|nr:hypothetical protein [Portunus trituberculatus]
MLLEVWQKLMIVAILFPLRNLRPNKSSTGFPPSLLLLLLVSVEQYSSVSCWGGVGRACCMGYDSVTAVDAAMEL